MNNPVTALHQRLASSGRAYQPFGSIGDAHAHIRFIGTFEGREVVWDARVCALRIPRAVAARPFLDISAKGRLVVGIRIGLAVAQLDETVLLKTIVMVRQYKRLRRGRHEFGEPVAPSRGIGKIVSGGQTGVDRAALDAAMELGIPCGGWCPRGRRAEDSVIPARYPVHETASTDYRERTRRNVRESDATLILAAPPLRGGTALTRRVAEKLGKPCLTADPTHATDLARVRDWLAGHDVTVLNVAGPRESGQPGIYRRSRRFLRRLLRAR